jgi:hypothetical protein
VQNCGISLYMAIEHSRTVQDSGVQCRTVWFHSRTVGTPYTYIAGQLGTALDSAGQLGTALGSAGQLGTALDSAGQLGTALDSAGQLGTALDSAGQLGTALGSAEKWGIEFSAGHWVQCNTCPKRSTNFV